MEMIKLFNVYSRAEAMHGYKNVQISWFVEKRPRRLFGLDGTLKVHYQWVIEDYDPADTYQYYSAMAVEEYFTEDEAKAFTDWLGIHFDFATTVEPAKLPIGNNEAGIGSIAVGGGDDFFVVKRHPAYDLPFEVWGYYDVRDCEFDETLSGARRALVGFRVTPGRIEPWLLLGDEL
jgi:hypothetical protein